MTATHLLNEISPATRAIAWPEPATPRSAASSAESGGQDGAKGFTMVSPSILSKSDTLRVTSVRL